MHARSMTLALVSSVLLAPLSLAPRIALGAPSAEDRAAAQSLFEEGGDLYRQGKFAEACQKLATSQKLEPAVGTLLNLGRCYEKIGRTASAWLVYIDASTAAKNTGHADRERIAREAAARLSPLLPKLVVVVPADAAPAGLEVKRDGVLLSASLWNQAAPIDPGDHEITFAAPGRKPASRKISAVPARQATVTAPVLDLDASHPVLVGGGDADRSRNASRLRTGAIVAGGLGIAALGFGTVFGLAARSDKATADRTCSGGRCSDRAGQDANDAAHAHAALSTIGFAVGAAAVVGTLVLYRLAVKERAKGSEAQSAFNDLNWSLHASPDARAGVLSMTGVWW